MLGVNKVLIELKLPSSVVKEDHTKLAAITHHLEENRRLSLAKKEITRMTSASLNSGGSPLSVLESISLNNIDNPGPTTPRAQGSGPRGILNKKRGKTLSNQQTKTSTSPEASISPSTPTTTTTTSATTTTTTTQTPERKRSRSRSPGRVATSGLKKTVNTEATGELSKEPAKKRTSYSNEEIVDVSKLVFHDDQVMKSLASEVKEQLQKEKMNKQLAKTEKEKEREKEKGAEQTDKAKEKANSRSERSRAMSAGESSCPTAVGVGGSGIVSREGSSNNNNGVGSDQMINQSSSSVLSDQESRRQSLMQLAIMTDPVWRIELGGFKFSKLSDDMLGMITVPANPGQSKALARPKVVGENSPPDGHRVQVKEFFFHSNRCASPLPPPSHSHNPTTATQRSLTVSMQGYLKYPPGSDNYEN